MHCREERRTLSRCFCQHITPLLHEIVRTRRRLEQRYYCFSKRDPRWVKEDGIRPRSCTLLLAALAFCPARACPPGNPSPSATIAEPQAGVKRRVEPCGRAWRGKGRSECPRPDGPAEDGCPKRRGQSRVTAIPPPPLVKSLSPREAQPRAASPPLACRADCPEREGAASRGQLSRLSTPNPGAGVRLRESRKTFLWATCTSSEYWEYWACAMFPFTRDPSPGFPRNSEGRV